MFRFAQHDKNDNLVQPHEMFRFAQHDRVRVPRCFASLNVTSEEKHDKKEEKNSKFTPFFHLASSLQTQGIQRFFSKNAHVRTIQIKERKKRIY